MKPEQIFNVWKTHGKKNIMSETKWELRNDRRVFASFIIVIFFTVLTPCERKHSQQFINKIDLTRWNSIAGYFYLLNSQSFCEYTSNKRQKNHVLLSTLNSIYWTNIRDPNIY